MDKLIQTKHGKVKKYLKANGLEGIVLASRVNFSWFTCGAMNYVNAASDLGEACLFITEDDCVCVSNNIDGGRIYDEELKGRGLEVLQPKWFDAQEKSKLWEDLAGGRKIAADIDVTGLNAASLNGDFTTLRYGLLDEEIQRYKQLGDSASKALESCGKTIQKAMSEFEIAALINKSLFDRDIRPWVTLVAVDDRIVKYRHPIPTTAKVNKTAQMVICAERHGLVCSATRIVSFGQTDDDLKKRHQAVVNVDAAFNLATKPGMKLSEIFEIGTKAYADNGYADDWQLHHQGGPAGYGPRDAIANFQADSVVAANQSFAWNPSITGTKSEDTMVATDSGPLFVSHAIDWPQIEAEYNGQKLNRPDILIR